MDRVKRRFDSNHQLATDERFAITYPDYGVKPQAVDKPQPISTKVLMITHDPILRSKGGKTVKEHFGWNDSEALAHAYIEDVRWASYGYVNYKIVEHLIVDDFPLKRDGFRYNESSYLAAWAKRNFHDPDGVNYHELVQQFQMIERINAADIDEVWLFGHPYGGYYESIMAGPDAFWCNAPALTDTDHAARRFVIMGFNFERGVGEMLEDLGHRAESMLSQVFKHTQGNANLWQRFCRYHQSHPDRAECGNVHFAPNSTKDYDWGNQRPVLSYCDHWYDYPKLNGVPRLVDCSEWGNGDIRLHHLWWFRHMPHLAGEANGIAHNWWRYIIDPNTVQG